MAGIKFHPPFQKVHLEDPKYEENVAADQCAGFPVLIHCGTAKIARPYDLYPSGVRKILKYAPDIPIIMAHMGSFCMMKNPEETLDDLPENVFIDTAMSAELEDSGEFEEIIRKFGPERTMYGCDFRTGARKPRSQGSGTAAFPTARKRRCCGKTLRKY